MATLDVDRECLVIRVVYDGPALSGKTTTLRALAASLGRDLFSGDEAEGRTLYFDWLDYTAGRFQGHPIRCQVLSVPGQRSLRSRRERLLQGADAVVFVADSRRSQLEAGRRTLDSLRGLLEGADPPSPGIVVQANKRDDPEAALLAEVRARLGADGDVAIRETVAVGGSGVRETFVMAVRMAIDRTRSLLQSGRLPKGRPDVDSGDDLLASLRRLERQPVPVGEAPAEADLDPRGSGAVAGATEPVQESEPDTPSAPRDDGGLAALRSARPRVPDASLPGGLLWPPVKGRITLHEATATKSLTLDLRPDGAWAGEQDGWRVHSPVQCLYLDLDAARKALMEWVHWHLDVARLSPRRCVLACPALENAYRLWQIVRREPSLAESLAASLEDPRAERLARRLVEHALAFTEGITAFEPLGLPCDAESLTLVSDRVVYAGLVPGPGSIPAACPPGVPPEERLRAAFEPVLAPRVEAGRLDVPRLLDPVRAAAESRNQARLGEVLAALLIGS